MFKIFLSYTLVGQDSMKYNILVGRCACFYNTYRVKTICDLTNVHFDPFILPTIIESPEFPQKFHHCYRIFQLYSYNSIQHGTLLNINYIIYVHKPFRSIETEYELFAFAFLM